jgi:NADH-quinone oxidoreductase subunit J
MIALFVVTAVLAIVSAVSVLVFKNPIHSALGLVAHLLAIAVFFAMLDAHFLAAVQIIVYAGAIMVLVLFMLMLLNLKVEQRSRRESLLAIFAIGAGGLFLVMAVPAVQRALAALTDTSPLRESTVPAVEGTVEAMGRILFTEYVFLFQASGVLLMAAIVAAVMLAKKQYSRS